VKERQSFLKSIIEPVTCGICKSFIGGLGDLLLNSIAMKIITEIVYLF